jgi:hypothetical protein
MSLPIDDLEPGDDNYSEPEPEKPSAGGVILGLCFVVYLIVLFLIRWLRGD